MAGHATLVVVPECMKLPEAGVVRRVVLGAGRQATERHALELAVVPGRRGHGEDGRRAGEKSPLSSVMTR